MNVDPIQFTYLASNLIVAGMVIIIGGGLALAISHWPRNNNPWV